LIQITLTMATTINFSGINDIAEVTEMMSRVFKDISLDQIILDITTLTSSYKIPENITALLQNRNDIKPILPPQFIVAYDNQIPVGIIGYREEMKTFGFYEIFYLGVLVGYRKEGIGTRLINNAIEKIKEDSQAFYNDLVFANLVCEAKNENFFTKRGFQTIHSFNSSTEMYFILKKKV